MSPVLNSLQYSHLLTTEPVLEARVQNTSVYGERIKEGLNKLKQNSLKEYVEWLEI
jgi:hypothetical protein